MKSLKLFVFSSLLLAVSVTSVKAATRAGEQVTLGKDETVNEDFFAAGQKIEIYGTINGDVYAAGGNVIIDGKVNGDVIVAGGDVQINGEVAQNVRVLGGNVNVAATIGRNLSFAGGNVDVAENAVIKGSVVGGGGDLTVDGNIGKNLRIGAGNLLLGATVAGNVESTAGEMTLGPKAKIAGDVRYWSKKDGEVNSGASISGQIVRSEPMKGSEGLGSGAKAAADGAFRLIKTMLKLTGMVIYLLVSLLIVKLLPTYSRRLQEAVRNEPLKSAGLGLLLMIASPFVIGFLFATVIGIPIALLLMAIVGVWLFFAKLPVTLVVGNWLLKKFNQKENDLVAVVVGLAAYELLTMIPGIGWLVRMATWIVGTGALILAKMYWLRSRNGKAMEVVERSNGKRKS